MPTANEIRDLKEHYVNNIYYNVRLEQNFDMTYINDTFEVPEIQEPHTIYRSGIGDRIVNAPAEHIVTSNPQVFFHPRKDTKAAAESAEKLSRLVNETWLTILQRQNPNIFKEFLKNLLGRGEAYFKYIPNMLFLKGQATMPVTIRAPEPMVVYASPEEDEDGVPYRIIIYYNVAQYKDLIQSYPDIKGLQEKAAIDDGQVQWLEYYDIQKNRYVEAGDILLTTGGVQKSLYGVPLVRRRSGFGRSDPSGALETLIVSDIKRSRDLIREECATRSNIASIEYLFAHKPKTFIYQGADADIIRDQISFGEYDINAIDADPKNIKIDEIDITPSPETYKHHSDLLAELNQRHPFILAGFPWGESGRQQDMTELSAMRRYDSVVENTEHAFAVVIKKCLQLCLIPGYMPKGISRKDIEQEYDIEVKLKAKDPLAEDRRITMGNRLWNAGRGAISLSKFHMDYLGMTQYESKKEIARMLADQITIYNPDIAALLGMVAAEESSMEDWLQKAQQRRMVLEQAGGMRKELPQSTQTRIQGEQETPYGYENNDQRGARTGPSDYTRG